MTDPRTTPDPNISSTRTPAMVSVPISDLNRHARHKRVRQVLLGARVTILGSVGGHSYVATEKDNYVGFINSSHLCANDPTTHRISALASHTYGKPYLWGGNSITSIDCSGLVQAALTVRRIPCTGDSDQQEKQLGKTVSPNSRIKSGLYILKRAHCTCSRC